MKLFTGIVLCMLLMGCDYEVPLQSSPTHPIDTRLIGQWERVDTKGKAERLLILPLGEKEYLAVFPHESPDAIFARAWSCVIDGRELVQLRWFGTAKGVVPDTDRVYQIVSYDVEEQSLRVSPLNTELVSRDVATSEELVREVKNNLTRSDLFRESLEFSRVPGTE